MHRPDQKPRSDRRLLGLALVVLGIGLLGTLIWLVPGRSPLPSTAPIPVAVPSNARIGESAGTASPLQDPPMTATPVDPLQDPADHVRQAPSTELSLRFQQAVVMLHAKQYDSAIVALQRVLKLSPQLPEAHVNMGFALLGKEYFEAARDSFLNAIELRPQQKNAYYGLAVSLEELGNTRKALEAMEAYIHLADEDSTHLRKARSAAWEWREQLTRQRADTNATESKPPVTEPPENEKGVKPPEKTG